MYCEAQVIYQLFCPGFIKTYSSYADYLKHHHSPRWIIWESQKVIDDENELCKLFERLNEKGYVNVSEKEVTTSEIIIERNQTVIFFTLKGQNYKMGLPIFKDETENSDETAIAEREIFWVVFGRYSSSRNGLDL